MIDEIVIAKCAIIERCVARVLDVYAGDPGNLRQDYTKQDSIVLNLQRAAEASIDLAAHLVRTRKLGVPARARDAFALLTEAGLLDASLAERLAAMVGFRNVAVHDYTKLDLDIVQAIVQTHLDDFRQWARAALALTGPKDPPTNK